MRHRTSPALVLLVIALSIPLSAQSAYAQRRRAVRVRPVRPVVVARVSRPSVWYGGWYDPWYGPGPFYGPYRYDNSASVRIQARPRQTEVYVDGAFAGLVDDFDGIFQRLRVVPGQHEVALYLEGFRTEYQDLYLAPGAGYTIAHDMIPLGPGDLPDPRPTPLAAPQPPQRPQGPASRRAPASPAYLPPRSPDAVDGIRESPARLGTLQIQVQPSDADVLIDGELWRGSEGRALVVQVSEGPHVIAVRRSGYRPLTTEVQVRPDETAPVNVSLTPD